MRKHGYFRQKIHNFFALG